MGTDPGVDPATGALTLTGTDVHLAATLPLVLTRTHLSTGRRGRGFGPSWMSTVDQRLVAGEQGATLLLADATTLVYIGELPRNGPHWPLERGPEGHTVRRPHPLGDLHFGADGALLAITGPGDTRIDLDRDPGGTLTGIRHSGGYRIAVRTADGLVTELRLGGPDDGVVLVGYRYEDGLLTEVTNSTGKALRFDYDTEGRVTRWEDRIGQWRGYTYDDRGRVVHAEGSGEVRRSWRYEGRTTIVTDSLGGETRYEHDEQGRPTGETDPLGNRTTSHWDGDRLAARTDPLGHTDSYAYTERGELAEHLRADGTRETIAHDERGLRTEDIAADGAVWRYTHDALGLPRSVTDPAGASTTFEHDERGHLRRIVDALGGEHRFDTDAAGLPVAATAPGGGTTRFGRDQFGRVTEVTDPVGGVTRLRWTVEGRLLERTRPDSSTERWGYDAEGNQVRHTDPLGKVTRIERTPWGAPRTEEGPEGVRLEYGYDTELRLTSVRNARGQEWRYAYDAAGRLVAETDFAGRTTRYGYDAAGRRTERVSPLGHRTRFVRDALGNVVERRCGEAVARFEFDPAGRLVRAANADADVTFAYDPLGRMTAETVNGRVLTVGYDALGRRVRRRTPSGSETTWQYGAGPAPTALRTAGRLVSLGYDPAGREVERLLDTGTIVATRWDPSHRLAELTVSVVGGGARVAANAQLIQRRYYQYREDGRVKAIEDQLAGTRRFELDAAGRVIGVRGPGWTESYRYDGTGEITGTELAATHPGTLLEEAGSVDYRVDAQGRVVRRRRKPPVGRPETCHFEWDVDDRLVGVVAPDGTRWRYRYDALGRRVVKQRLGGDRVTVAEQVDFSWDGAVLAEQAHWDGQRTRVSTWNYRQHAPITQVERVFRGREWVDDEFYTVVTDLVGAPTELVDTGGHLAWHAQRTLWGLPLREHEEGYADTPLRFPGQYHDDETGLHYHVLRYYDPATARFASTAPLDLARSPDPDGYVPDPLTQSLPLGLGSPLMPKAANDALPALNAPNDALPAPNVPNASFTAPSVRNASLTAFGPAYGGERMGDNRLRTDTPPPPCG